MSKNTVKVAQAISLLSDVLSSEVECELNEDTETVDDEYDELKEQALDFSKDLADELTILSDDLERILDPTNDDDADASDWKPLADYEDDDQTGTMDAEAGTEDDAAGTEDVEADVGNGEVDISDVTADDADESEPTATAGEVAAHQATAVLSEKNAELEKNNEELNDKLEGLTDTIRGWRWQIENLQAVADTFVSEVENL
jgi:chaperonin cofactor prefoldin